MSSIFIHIGQCGNQIGIPLWKNFAKCCNTDKHVFETLEGYQRSVHIDSEPKVIQSFPKSLRIRDGNVVIGKRGRGTNFALGYHGMTSAGDDHILEQSINAVRKEMERCDMYSGAIVFHSLSGGTGSGLGAHMIESLREEFPCGHILSCAVAPCVSGESPLQNYNALLTLHWLHNYSDAVIFLQNDLLIDRAKGTNCEEDSSHRRLSFRDINKFAADNLGGLFLPTDTLSTSSGMRLGQEPWELVRTLTSMPGTKYLSVGHHSSPKLSWSGMASKVLKQIPKYDSSGQPTKSLSLTTVARGDTNDSFLSDLKQGVDKKLRRGLHCVDWNPYPIDCWTAKENPAGGSNHPHSSLSLAVNSSCVIDHFSVIGEQALAKLNAGAYLHWYQRYGMDKDVFEEGLETLQETISEYRQAIS